MPLNADAILNAQDRQTKTVAVPEWGGDVLLGAMGALDRARIRDWMKQVDERRRPPTRPAATTAADEDEEREPFTVVTTDSPAGKPERIGGAPEPESEAAEPDVPDDDPGRHWTRTDHTELMLRYLVASILDPATMRPAFVLTQMEALGRKDPAPLERLYVEALQLNRDTKEDAEDVEKNSEGTPGGDSGGD